MRWKWCIPEASAGAIDDRTVPHSCLLALLQNRWVMVL
jgi:hypothetical protein